MALHLMLMQIVTKHFTLVYYNGEHYLLDRDQLGLPARTHYRTLQAYMANTGWLVGRLKIIQ